MDHLTLDRSNSEAWTNRQVPPECISESKQKSEIQKVINNAYHMYKGNTFKEKEFSRSDFSNNVALSYEPKSENDSLNKKKKGCKTT